MWRYCQGDYIKKYEVGLEYRTHGKYEKYFQTLIRKLQGKNESRGQSLDDE
jgi:hypothetical protein